MNKICSKCQRAMVLRNSARGQFYGCSGYPNCKNTEPLEGSKPSGGNPNGGMEIIGEILSDIQVKVNAIYNIINKEIPQE